MGNPNGSSLDWSMADPTIALHMAVTFERRTMPHVSRSSVPAGSGAPGAT